MKRIVQLAVVVAALLMLGSVASAQWCECYEVTSTNLETGESSTGNVGLCFEPWNDRGMYFGICGSGPMALFWDVRKRALIDSDLTGFLEFHGGISGLTGIVFCPGGTRYEMRGHKVDYDECPWG